MKEIGEAKFPASPDTFIAYQKQRIGRELSECERDIAINWMESFNIIYEFGLEQNRAALVESSVLLDKMLEQYGDFTDAHKFTEACRAWIIKAWRQGAQHGKKKRPLLCR